MKQNSSPRPDEEAHRDDTLPKVARLCLVVLGVLLAVQVSAILSAPTPPRQVAAGLASVAVLGVLQARHLGFVAPMPRRPHVALLVVEGLLTYLPMLAVGAVWPGTGGFLAASVLLVAPGRAAWVVFAAVIASVFAAGVTLGPTVGSAVAVAVAGLAVGLTTFTLCRLTRVIEQLRGVHTEMVQLAVIRERMRFARDLHDLLGYSLAAITLRAELARRLMRSDSARAGDELRDVVATARQAVAEVREMADGYRNISLAQEVAAVASLFGSANITTRVEVSCGVLPDKVDSVLAMVLRELSTNILRHSSARNCWIAVEQTGDDIRLSVVNDGVRRASTARRDGGGLDNLASRLQAVGGTLSASTGGDGRFHVLAEVAGGADPVATARPHRAGYTPSSARRPLRASVEGSYVCCGSCSPRMSRWSAGHS